MQSAYKGYQRFTTRDNAIGCFHSCIDVRLPAHIQTDALNSERDEARHEVHCLCCLFAALTELEDISFTIVSRCWSNRPTIKRELHSLRHQLKSDWQSS